MSYQDKYIKYKNKYNNFKLLGGRPERAFYSDDNIDYSTVAREYQLDAVKLARAKDYSDKLPYNYNNVVEFKLYPIDSTKLTFLCVRTNGTFFYLRYYPKTTLRYERRIATEPITINTEYGKNLVLNPGTVYYYDKLDKLIPIGYKGSTDPPISSSHDVPLIDINEEINE